MKSIKEQDLLKQFIKTFQKAIHAEMEAMRRQMGPFEVSLNKPQPLETEDQSIRLVQFQVGQPNEKLVLQTECTLVFDSGQCLVTIDALAGNNITLKTQQAIPPGSSSYTLVIYPWFLYESLLDALDSLPDDKTYFVRSALRLFGKLPATQTATRLRQPHTELNQSQRQAVQLCSDSDLAFVWGPPGTGKTTTLGHIITELLAQGQRLLITSTTNAAVDQALASLAALPNAAPHFAQGEIVRLGQTSAPTYGASVSQVMAQLHARSQARLKRLQTRRPAIERQLIACRTLSNKLEAGNQPVQLGLFQDTAPSSLTPLDLQPLFSAKRHPAILSLPTAEQQALIARRQTRLEQVRSLCQDEIRSLHEERRLQESMVVRQAQVVMATMTNVYLSRLLTGQRFDMVIVEEAGMAILPTLFYCAALAKSKVILVGDPKQLPPIVQASDPFVYRAMGRNIFDITVPDPHQVQSVVMLDTQYRMHPVIGDLVSRLYYEGRLRHGANTAERRAMAERDPYPQAPLIVIDTEGQTTCARQEGGYSRYNEQSARICIDLAVRAIRAGLESVAIITPYAAQSRLIRRELSRYQAEAAQIECATVHRFQGNERDMVIVDTVDTAPFSPGVLLASTAPTTSADNLINVSISRARGKLILVSDVGYFRRQAPKSAVTVMLNQALTEGQAVSWQEDWVA